MCTSEMYAEDNCLSVRTFGGYYIMQCSYAADACVQNSFHTCDLPKKAKMNETSAKPWNDFRCKCAYAIVHSLHISHSNNDYEWFENVVVWGLLVYLSFQLTFHIFMHSVACVCVNRSCVHRAKKQYEKSGIWVLRCNNGGKRDREILRMIVT